MALQLFDVAGGYSIDELAQIITGTGIPGSGTNDSTAQTALQGAVYIRTGAGNSEIYTKISAGATVDNWLKQASLQDVEEAIGTLEFQDSALDYIVDNTIAPPTENLGDRYVLSHDGGVPNAAYDGASAGDIVEFDGTNWVATTPTTGTFISVDDEATLLYYFGGAAWTTKLFEATTASTGVVKVGQDIQLADATSNAISVTSGVIDIIADGIDDTMIDFGLGAGQVSAADLPIDNTASGLTATDTQGAIDELDSRLDAVEGNSNTQVNTLGNTGGATVTADTVLTQDIMAITWHVLLEDTTDGDREFVQVTAAHDGTDGNGDATEADYNTYSKLRVGNVPGDVFEVDIDGTGATQTMRLRVTANNNFDVRVLRSEFINF